MITALIVFAAVFLFGLVVYAVIRVTDRDEERDPFAQAALTVTPVDGFADLGPRPAEIAHEAFLAAPLPTLPPGTAEHADPTLTIDPVRYGHNLRYRYSGAELDGDIETPAAAHPTPSPAPPPVARVHLPPVTGWAVAVLAAITAPIRERVAAVEQAEADAFQAEALAVFPEWKPWAGDDTITRGIPVFKAGA